MVVGEVFVDTNGLIRSRRHHGELDGAGGGTACRRYFPVRGDFAGSRLVIGEGCAVGVWRRSAVDDEGGVTIEGEAGGVEGVTEVVGPAGISYIQNRSFEAGWKGGDATVMIEAGEEIGSYCGYFARVEAACWQTGECAIRVEPGEEIVSYRPGNSINIKTMFW